MINLTLEELAKGIAATMSKEDLVRITGDHASGGIYLITYHQHTSGVTLEEVDCICYGVKRPELDEFAELIRMYHRKRF